MSIRDELRDAIDEALGQRFGYVSREPPDGALPARSFEEENQRRAAFAERLRRFLDAAPASLSRDELRGALEEL